MVAGVLLDYGGPRWECIFSSLDFERYFELEELDRWSILLPILVFSYRLLS